MVRNLFLIGILGASLTAATPLISQTTRTRPSPVIQQSGQRGCPNLSISAKDVEAGHTVQFSLNPQNAEIKNQKFEWNTSFGKIISGQGTSEIIIETYKKTPVVIAGSNSTQGIPPGFVLDSPVTALSSWGGPRGIRMTVSAKISSPVLHDCPLISNTFLIPRSEAFNQPANVEELTLDKTNVVLPCEPGRSPSSGGPFPDPIVNVSTTAKDPENDVITYQYTVSGGKIIGNGADVKWDLTGVAPGTYTITAGADDGCGICGKTKTQTITVEAFPGQCVELICPMISLSEPQAVGLDEYVVSANVTTGSPPQNVTYKWFLTNAEILSGQDTAQVRVKAWTDPNGKEPVITAQMGGLDPRMSCPTIASVNIHTGSTSQIK